MYRFLIICLLVLLAGGCANQGVAQTATVLPSPSTLAATATTVSATPPAIVPTPSPGPSLVASPSASSTPSIFPGPTLPSTQRSPTELKYLLISQLGEPFFCDPDYYPVAHDVSDQEVAQRVAALEKNNPEEFNAILKHLGLAGGSTLSTAQKRAVYTESKKLNAVTLQAAGSGYEFSLRVGGSGQQGMAISGQIDANGRITVTLRQPAILTCPICLAANTLIETPRGPIRVQDLEKGMPIWTADASGARRTAVVLETISRPVPADFQIVRLALDDGRSLLVSPNHPTNDGRTVGELSIGDYLDGSRVTEVMRVPYEQGATYDILPSGLSGAYWANGILLKSTLAP